MIFKINLLVHKLESEVEPEDLHLTCSIIICTELEVWASYTEAEAPVTQPNMPLSKTPIPWKSNKLQKWSSGKTLF